MSEFVIKVPEIPADGGTYSFCVRAAWLRRALEGTGLRAPVNDVDEPSGVVEVRVEKSGEDVLVRGRARAVLLAECCRCLEDARVSADAEVVALFTARGGLLRRAADEDELAPEEVVREFFTGDEIALDALVRELIILEVPMKPLCAETCPGIEIPAHVRPPSDFPSKKRDGVDPRLAPLKDVRVAPNKE